MYNDDMQPTSKLEFFRKDISFIKGIGPKVRDILKPVLGSNITETVSVWHFLKHIPRRYETFQLLDGMTDEWIDKSIEIPITVIEHSKLKFSNRRIPFQVKVQDGLGQFLYLNFFSMKTYYITSKFPIGAKLVLIGKGKKIKGRYVFYHPDARPFTAIELNDEDTTKTQKIQSIYPATANISQKIFLKLQQGILPHIPDIGSPYDKFLYTSFKFPSFKQAITELHNQSETDEDEVLKARQKLAFDEVFVSQFSVKLRHYFKRSIKSKENIIYDGNLLKKAKSLIPFELTDGQKVATDEIIKDISSPYQMFRLLQGDVGSGKTIVVFLAMIQIVSRGTFQSVLVAPTELLAKQHFATLKPYADKLNINIVLLSGSQTVAEKKAIRRQIASGFAQMIIGTHTIFQDTTEFKNLRLAIIDEQHRFGVRQRSSLLGKNDTVDLLLMSATPIPRTLQMMMQGHMDISIMKGKPANRLPVKTSLISSNSVDKLIERLKYRISNSEKIFWVCPIIDESDTINSTPAIERFEYVRNILGDKVGLLHGQIKPVERDKIMADFIKPDGKVKIIIATTVIEVGVDVSDATVMIIESPERFGLAQLHQLRGRVGRGDKQSYCILLSKDISQNRLKLMTEIHDGFRLAEYDLMHRGEGDALGIKQSGRSFFNFVNVFEDQNIITASTQYAQDLFDEYRDILKDIENSNKFVKYLMKNNPDLYLILSIFKKSEEGTDSLGC
ncbi:MAG: ATP-dependent DNA helicase RecG [Alphaproteobacteria bacterium]|nr:ATP-dependent DNA helicase RecG [Alphaproteobacteria bacterium]